MRLDDPGTGEALDGGRGGVPHNKVPPSPGEEKGARGMRSAGEFTSIDLNLPLGRRLRSAL